MATKNFTPTVWSATLTKLLESEYVAAKHCNRDYEGEIKQCGDTVHIFSPAACTIRDYTVDTDLTDVDNVEMSTRSLTITKAKYFNFQVDDVDKIQSKPELLNSTLKKTALSLRDLADQYLFQVCAEATNTVTANVTVDNIIDVILLARTKLFLKNVTNNDDVFIELSPQLGEMLLKAKMNLSHDNSEQLENGCIGKLFGCKVFVTNAIKFSRMGSDLTYNCFVRTKDSVAFAEQLSEVEAYRLEKRFADGIKGLHLYGACILDPNQIVKMTLTAQAGQ